MSTKYRIVRSLFNNIYYKEIEEEWACSKKDLLIAVSSLSLVEKDRYIARTFSAMYKAFDPPASFDTDYIENVCTEAYLQIQKDVLKVEALSQNKLKLLSNRCTE